MRRREFLQQATCWTAAALAGPPVGLPQRGAWSAGDLVHLLPTVNDNRILLKFSLHAPLPRPPRLRIGSRAFTGESTDTESLFWSVDATDLEPATRYELALEDDRGHELCDPWPLSTFPASSGPLGTGRGGWPSTFRGTRGLPPDGLDVEEGLPCLEENGFILVDFELEGIVIRYFRWNNRQDPIEAIDSLEPFRVTQLQRRI